MAIGLIGRKLGMTRVFNDAGASVPVTVVHFAGNRVTQVKTPAADGYSALQVTTDRRKPSRVRKPIAGHYAKAGVEAGRGLWEFRLANGEGDGIEIGADLNVDRFQVGQKVDATGISKGKGFAGAVKRHNFRTQDATHGNSLSHRAPGSIGQAQTPGRVLKGKKMAGQMGNVRTTSQNLEIVRVDGERNLLLIKGALPGARGGDVLIYPAAKARGGAGAEA